MRKRKPSRANNHTRRLGRPTLYSPELAQEICERLSKPESMRTICADAHMPSRGTVASWMATNPTFCAMIMHARELQAEALADQMLAIADDASSDIGPDGKVVWETVQRAKLRCDARRWYAAKLAPKRFGDKVLQEVSGVEGAPVQIERPLAPAELAKVVTELLTQAEKDIGLVVRSGATKAERFRAILSTGEPLPPALYAAIQESKHGYH